MNIINQIIINVLQHFSYIIDTLSVIVNIICALAVTRDLNYNINIIPKLMTNFSWIFTVLITGILGLLIYWIIHYSSLCKHSY